MRMIDLSGQKVGLLTVKHPCCKLSVGKANIFWTCDCECSTTDHLVPSTKLTGKNPTISCGCMQGAKHGHRRGSNQGQSPSLTYQSWRGMKERCLSPKHIQYKDYGGRGIKVCDRWLGEEGFQNFLNDMGERPERKYTLDRYPDVNGNYCPENCRWATYKEQGRNKRQNKIWTVDGVDYCESELVEMYGLNLRTFRHRIDLGWTLEDALNKPVAKAPTLTYQGKTLTYTQWSKETGIHKDTIKTRIERGWSAENALCSPAS